MTVILYRKTLKGIDMSTLVLNRQKDLIILRDWIMSLVPTGENGITLILINPRFSNYTLKRKIRHFRHQVILKN